MTETEPKYQLERTAVFRKDLKRAKKRGLDLLLLNDIVTALQYGENCPKRIKTTL